MGSAEVFVFLVVVIVSRVTAEFIDVVELGLF